MWEGGLPTPFPAKRGRLGRAHTLWRLGFSGGGRKWRPAASVFRPWPFQGPSEDLHAWCHGRVDGGLLVRGADAGAGNRNVPTELLAFLRRVRQIGWRLWSGQQRDCQRYEQ